MPPSDALSEAHARCCGDDDPLAPARGIAVALVLSLVWWTLLGAIGAVEAIS